MTTIIDYAHILETNRYDAYPPSRAYVLQSVYDGFFLDKHFCANISCFVGKPTIFKKLSKPEWIKTYGFDYLCPPKTQNLLNVTRLIEFFHLLPPLKPEKHIVIRVREHERPDIIHIFLSLSKCGSVLFFELVTSWKFIWGRHGHIRHGYFFDRECTRGRTAAFQDDSSPRREAIFTTDIHRRY